MLQNENLDLSPVASEEETEELEYLRDAGRKVKNMVNHPGWKEIVKPKLVKQREALMHELLSAAEYRDLVRLQQSVNIIENLFGFINASIEQGMNAIERLNRVETDADA